MSGIDNYFLESVTKCLVSVYDGGAPEKTVAPNGLARPEYFPRFGSSGAPVLGGDETVLGHASEVLLAYRKWTFPIGYDDTKPVLRWSLWTGDRPTTVLWLKRGVEAWLTTRRLVFRWPTIVGLPGLDSRRAVRRLSKTMVGEPFVAGQVLLEWVSHVSVYPAHASFYLADTSWNQSGGAEFLVPARIQLEAPGDSPATDDLMEAIAKAAINAELRLEVNRDSAGSVAEFTTMRPRKSIHFENTNQHLADGRAYRLVHGEPPSFSAP